MSKYKNNNQSGQRQQFQPEDLSLKGYYAIAALSVTIGIVTVGLLNLATPLEIISDRMAFVSQFSGPLFLLFIPPLIYLLLVYILSLLVVRIILGPISRYQNIVTLGGSISEDLEEKAGRRLLNVPFIFIPAVLVLWIVISAIPWLGGYLSGQVDLRTAVIIFARTSMVGLISAFVASHLMENYSRKKLIPYFFPQGRLVDVGGTFRISISRRIQLLNPLGTLVPGIVLLVTLVTLQWEVDTSQISSAEYGWIIIRFSLILIGIFFIMAHVLNRVGSRSITDPIKEIIRVLKRIRKGQFDGRVEVVSNDEIGYTGDVINEMTEGLRERELMKRSLELAMEVQQNLLPKENPQIKGLDIAGKSIYCDETGGDYFDFINLEESPKANIAIVVGDVSGHGIPSALLMATARAFIRQRSQLSGEMSQIISDVNRQIAGDVEDSGQFMTLFYVVVDQDGQCVEWVRAGHDPGIFYDPQSDLFEELAGPGLALGVDGEWNYATNRKEGLKEGQIIVLGTDGIWETQNPQGELLGKEAVCKIIRENTDAGASALLDIIIDELDRFRDGHDFQDDVTLIVLKIGKI
jgi:sigma-B regulation protein RsbU (phosphoserine phosphatase)